MELAPAPSWLPSILVDCIVQAPEGWEVYNPGFFNNKIIYYCSNKDYSVVINMYQFRGKCILEAYNIYIPFFLFFSGWGRGKGKARAGG